MATKQPAPVRGPDFDTREAAEAHAAQLRQQGRSAAVVVIEQPLDQHVVQLGPYPRRTEAEQVATRLRQQGIETSTVVDRFERGFAVAAGAFTDKTDVSKRIAQLRQLGFSNIHVVSEATTVTRYRVEETKVPTVAKPPEAKPEQEAAPQVLVFGAPAPAAAPSAPPNAPPAEQTFHVGIDKLRAEVGILYRSDRPADTNNYLHGAFSAEWNPNTNWEARAAGRVDGYYQTGDSAFATTELDYGDSFIRYRGEQGRITVGPQTIIWGRVDEIPPTDRLSVRDLSRYLLDELPERRRSVTVLRGEYFHHGYKLDAQWVPWFREAELPDRESIWSPIDQTRGRILGFPPNPLLAPLVQHGRFGDDTGGEGGYGVRLSRTSLDLDWAVTAQRARQSEPYYELNPVVRSVLLATGDPQAALAAGGASDTFVGRHPLSWVFGGDVALEAAGATWRFEAAYLTDLPVTTADLRYKTEPGAEWVAGVEFYPGDGDARVNLQLAGRHLFDAGDILDREHIYNLNGEAENVFAKNRWRAKVRFAFGLDEYSVYLNPQIAYIGWEPHELYLAWHYFDGDDETFNGFYENNDLIAVGWRTSL